MKDRPHTRTERSGRRRAQRRAGPALAAVAIAGLVAAGVMAISVTATGAVFGTDLLLTSGDWSVKTDTGMIVGPAGGSLDVPHTLVDQPDRSSHRVFEVGSSTVGAGPWCASAGQSQLNSGRVGR